MRSGVNALQCKWCERMHAAVLCSFSSQVQPESTVHVRIRLAIRLEMNVEVDYGWQVVREQNGEGMHRVSGHTAPVIRVCYFCV